MTRTYHTIWNEIKVIILLSTLFSFPLHAQNIYSLTGEEYDSLAFNFFTQGQVDSSLFYFNKAAAKFDEDENYPEVATQYANIFGVNYFSGNLDAAENAIKSLEPIFQDYLTEKDSIYPYIANSIGVYCKEKGDYIKALDYYQKTIADEAISDELRITALKNIAIIYDIQGDTESAINYSKRGLKIAQQKIENLLLIPDLYSSIGHIYQNNNERDSAKIYFQRSLGLLNSREKLEVNLKRFQVDNLLKLSELAFEEEDYTTVKEQIKSLEKIYDKNYSYHESQLFIRKGQISSVEGNQQKAEQFFNNAKSIAKENYKTFERIPSLARPYEYSSAYYLKQKKYDKAYEDVIKGLELASVNYIERPSSNIDFIENDFIDIIQSIQLLYLKARIEEALFKETKEERYISEGIKTYELIYRLNRLLRNELYSSQSTIEWSKKNSAIYQDAFLLCVMAYELGIGSNKEEHLEKAFFFTEASKAISLAENINLIKTQEKHLPENIVSKSRQLSTDIAYYQKQLNIEKQKKNIDVEKVKKRTDKLFALEKENRLFIQDIEHTYPDYLRRKQSFTPISLPKVQQGILNDKTALIEFYETEKYWWIFTITQNDIFFNKQEKSKDFKNSIVQFQKIISSPPESETYLSDLKIFVELGEILYGDLLEKNLENLKNIDKLIIIPEGRLSTLPFELLLNSHVKVDSIIGYSTNELPYLFEEFNITYNFSATVLNAVYQDSIQKFSNDNIIFSPAFNKKSNNQQACGTATLSYLKCNIKEGIEIHESIAGKLFSKNEATIAHFREELSKNNIIHLATHACIDSTDNNETKIFFSDNYLTLQDLNSMSIKANLVVLSACNTGNGKLLEGEGVMSLARSFFYAGASSAVMSFWSVDDCSTSELLIEFYHELKNGSNNSEALAKAKYNYINKSDLLHQHPYFWSAFVVSGDDIGFSENKIDILSYSNTIGICFLIFVIFYKLPNLKRIENKYLSHK